MRVVAQGMEGVGKTFTFRTCEFQDGVKDEFRDGVMYMSLCGKSGIAYIIQNISNFVHHKVEYKIYKKIANENDLRKCVSIVSRSLTGVYVRF